MMGFTSAITKILCTDEMQAYLENVIYFALSAFHVLVYLILHFAFNKKKELQ